MALITNSKDSLFGGVNQQAAEHRLPNQVVECINAYPTVNSGLLKRNPTTKLPLGDNINYTPEMFVYAYDRGLAGDKEEKYAVTITDEGMVVIDTVTGDVFNETNGKLIYDGVAKNYLSPFGGANGYSAVTIKDTTFLLNKNVNPRMKYGSYNGVDTSVETKHQRTLAFSKSATLTFDANNFAPYRMKLYAGKYKKAETSSSFFTPVSTLSYFTYNSILGGGTALRDLNGYAPVPVADSGGYYLFSTYTYKTFRIYDIKNSTFTIDIDGFSTSYTTEYECKHDAVYGTTNCIINSRETFAEWITNIKNRIREMLPINGYYVDIDASNNLRIIKFDGTDMTISTSLTFDNSAFRTLPSNFIISSTTLLEPVSGDYFDGVTASTTNETVTVQNTAYASEGYIWIKSSNPTNAYTYNVVIKDDLDNTVSISTTKTTTEAAATDLATQISLNANFTATSVGSVVKITSDTSTMKSVETSDSYGNQASFGWGRTVANYTELPKKLGYDNAIVFVEGDVSSSFNGYWLTYVNGSWKETVDPSANTVVDERNMPHILTREFDATGNVQFRLKAWDGWDDRAVGDDESNSLPSFMDEGSAIKDIFFFKNRLGFITQRNVILSDVGNYGNFFRTSVVAVLDSDRIDTTVDTTKAIELEYATYLEDSLMLFSDKAQFKLEGGTTLTPKSIQVSQTSAYEINKNVRPIFMNDKVFFCAKRGDYTAVMQYHVYGDGRISEAVDVTSHADKYIPIDVNAISGSPINNMLFMTTKSQPNTVFVYKYLDSGDERVQSAWFKWIYNGDLYRVFSFGKNLNMLINRLQSSVVSDWILGDAIWDSEQLWTSDGIWYGSEAELSSTNNFEFQQIHQQDYTDYFVDASEFVEDTTTVNNITSTLTSSNLTYTCNVQMLNNSIIKLDNEDIINYTITANTFLGESYSSTNEPLLLARDSSDYVTSIVITIGDAVGTVFTGFSFTYQTEDPIELLYNSLFQNGVSEWTFTNWTINYGEKDIGSTIPVRVELGEWVFKSGGVAQTRGTLKMKTCQINSEDGSDFELEIRDVRRDSTRKVKSRYTVDRKPMVYGDSRNMRLAILNNTENGFRINSVSLEGNYNSRSRRL